MFRRSTRFRSIIIAAVFVTFVYYVLIGGGSKHPPVTSTPKEEGTIIIVKDTVEEAEEADDVPTDTTRRSTTAKGRQARSMIQPEETLLRSAAKKSEAARPIIATTEEGLFALARANLARDKYLVLTIANSGHTDFVLNWIESLRRVNVSTYLVLCVDRALYELLLARRQEGHVTLIPPDWLNRLNLSAQEEIWDSLPYVSITHAKTLVVRRLLDAGFTVWFNDDDVVWLSAQLVDYIDYVTMPHSDLVYMWDGAHVNTGFYIAKPTARVKELFKATLEAQARVPDKNDQYLMNVEAIEKFHLDREGTFQDLDKLLFPNGQVYFQHAMNARVGVEPLALHANCFVGKAAKVQALKTAKMWYI